MPVLTYGFNAGALLTQGGWVSFSCLLAGHFLMLVHSGSSTWNVESEPSAIQMNSVLDKCSNAVSR
jgi:hypothetical protein